MKTLLLTVGTTIFFKRLSLIEKEETNKQHLIISTCRPSEVTDHGS